MKRFVTEYALYRWRYVIGYTIAALLVTGVFIFGAFFVPDGLRIEEREAALISGSLSYTDFDPTTVVNLPYHLLQRLSFEILGVTTISIKLASVLLGLLSVIGIFVLLREWFRDNVAIITGFIALSMPALIFAAQDGTAAIFVIATSVWLLVSAMHVSRQRKPRIFWEMLAFTLVGFLLYAPLGIYLVLAVASTIIFHPHLRIMVRRLNVNVLVAGSLLALLLMAPLIYSVTSQSDIGLRLLGVPTEQPDFRDNAITLFTQLFGSVSGDTFFATPPLLSLGILAITVIGTYRFFLIKHTARSYIIWFWSLTLLPFVYLNPQYTVYLLPLTVLMVGMGIDALTKNWYSMFPLNPYARVVGLLPLTIIVVGIIFSGIGRYAIIYNNSPEVAGKFSQDLRLLDTALATIERQEDRQIPILVDAAEQPFYELVASYRDDIAVQTNVTQTLPIVANHSFAERSEIAADPSRIITNKMREDADRFYIYTDAPE